jgi:hypothetical protein
MGHILAAKRVFDAEGHVATRHRIGNLRKAILSELTGFYMVLSEAQKIAVMDKK